MKVILTQDVRGQGKKGQLLEVSDGYARNYLLPRNLAMQATNDNLNALKLKEKAKAAQIEKEKAAAKETAEKLEGLIVTLKAKAGAAGKLYGAVTSMEVAEALAEQHGIEIEKNKIVMTDPIKTFGSYELKCKLGHEISGKINLLVVEG